MNQRILNQFLVLTDTLNFGRASDISNISISALSRNIRQLEEELGAKLFLRDNRTVSLTNEGSKFLIYTRDATRQWNSIKHELSNTSGILQGEISVFCSVTASYSILYDLLNRFRENYPAIEIKLHTGDPELAIARVIAGDEDIAIAARPHSIQRNLVFKPIIMSPLLFIGPVDKDATGPTPPSIKQPVSKAQWANMPMILSESGIARNRVDAWFNQIQVKPKIYAQVAGNEAIVSMVSLGLGVGVVPKIVIDNSPVADRIRILDIKPELEPYDIGLFTQKRALKNPLINAFWSLTG